MEIVIPGAPVWGCSSFEAEFTMVETLCCASPLVFRVRIVVPWLSSGGDAQDARTDSPIVHIELESADDEYVLFVDVYISEPPIEVTQLDSLLEFCFLDVEKERFLITGYQ